MTPQFFCIFDMGNSLSDCSKSMTKICIVEDFRANVLKLDESPLCTFCGKDEETREHLFVFCQSSRAFWKEISSWLRKCGFDTLPDLTDQVNIMFALFDAKSHFMLLNHSVNSKADHLFLQTKIYCSKPYHIPCTP